MFDKNRLLSSIAFFSAMVILLTIAGLYAYNIVRWINYPNFGFGWGTQSGIGEVRVVMEHGRKAGIQVGDRVITVNEKKYSNLKELRSITRRALGEENVYLIERDGKILEIVITNIPSGFKRSFSISGLPFLLSLSYILIGALVFMMRSHERTSWVFFLFTSTFGLLLMFLYKLGVMKPSRILESANLYAYTFTPAVFIHLAFSFPSDRRIVQEYPYVQLVPYIFSLYLFIRIRSFSPSIIDAPKQWLLISAVYMAVGVLIFLGSCLQLRLTSDSDIVKLRARIILLGFAIAASLPLVDFLSETFFHVYLVPGFNYYLPFFIVFPAFVGYSIVKHDLFDIDAIIKRTYGYILTTGSIAGIYGIFVLVSNLAFGGSEFSNSPIFPLIFILAVVFLFNPIRNRVQKFIDRVFYRLEYDYQETVHKISETMRTLLGLDEIGQSIMNVALGTMFIDSGAVILRRRDEDVYKFLIRAGKKDEAFANSRTQRVASPSDAVQKSDEADREKGDTSLVLQAGSKDINLPGQALAADQPLIKKIIEKKKEVTIYDILEAPFFEDERESCQKVFEQLDATLIVPLIYEERLTGLISLGRKKSGKFYRREDINLLNILANQGAVAIENAQMVQEVVEKERMEEELAIARDLQVSMLPAACPEVEGFEIAAFSISAREVGGDFYDFIEMGEGKTGMIIGDVTGKSVSGALVMSASRSVFRMLSEEKLPVGESMIRANRRIKKDIITGMFVALLYGVLDARERTLILCSAGQTQPIHLNSETGKVSLVETIGDTFPLGILDDVEYQDTRLRLGPGDKVVFYTDGIVEAMNEQQEMFGFERLVDIVQESKAMGAEFLLKEILDAVNDFTAGAEQHDDLTIISISATH